MTTRPQLDLGTHLIRGTAAVLLFGVMAVTVLGANLGSPAGFPDVTNITAGIGYAMFDISDDVVTSTGTESFLVAFIIIAFVLDAALEGAVMLARREDDDAAAAASSAGGERE
jgi:NADH-quinone oxidoreductase subunit J